MAEVENLEENTVDRKKARAALKRQLAALNKKDSLHLDFGLINPVKFIETPFVTLNRLIGGGIPRGKFTTIAGPERTAKGTLLLQTIGHKMQQDPDFTVLWTDAEDALDEDWCIKHGIDLERFVVQKYSADAPYFEKLLDDGLKLIETGGIDMWVIDSVAALMPKAEEGKDIEENTMLDLQRKLPVFFRKATRIISLANTSCVLIGQIYNVPNAQYVQQEVKGGNALKHFAHLRLLTRRGNQQEAGPKIDIKMPDGTVRKVMSGWAAHIKVDKTRINENEGRSIMLKFVYGRGLDSVEASITALFAHDVFSRSGGWFYHDKLPEGKMQGKDNLILHLKENSDLREELITELDKELVENFAEEAIDDTIETE